MSLYHADKGLGILVSFSLADNTVIDKTVLKLSVALIVLYGVIPLFS